VDDASRGANAGRPATAAPDRGAPGADRRRLVGASRGSIARRGSWSAGSSR